MSSESDIRANSVLPARRTPLTLQTADGLNLVGELALPERRHPVATLVCVHPLPTHGGMMDSHLFRKASYRLPALADVAVLRFNTRGTQSVQGRSEGEFDQGEGERYDLAAALEYAEFEDLPNIWLLGWSFGTDLVLRYGSEPGVAGMILLSPSLRWSRPQDLRSVAEFGRPLVVFVPELDDNLRPDEARRRFAAIPDAEVIGVDGAKHLWVGYAERILDEIVARVAPGTPPLPRTWDGPMTMADASAYADRTVAAYENARRDPAE